MTDAAPLIAQLRVLAHLTRAEAQAARLRLLQATGDDVREVVARTADDADERAGQIADALRDLGALPDPVTPVLGRVAALVRGAVAQAQPLDEALLGDLALEHLLGDRARYVAVLADTAGRPAVRALADDLGAAHAAHAQWLNGVLADLARGRAAALDPSPSQRVAAQVARAANTPGPGAPDDAPATGPGTEAPTTGSTDPAATDPAATDPAATDPAATDPAADTDPAPPSAPAEPGPPRPDPLPGFTGLPAHAAIAALRTLDDPREVAAVLADEQAHGDRPGVVAAARVRAAVLAG